MGAIQLQATVFPRGLQREAESLSQETDVAVQAAGLRSFAARLERRRPDLSLQIYSLLADSPTTPEAHRRVARDRFAALQGHGSGGARWETLIGKFLPEATDYRMIVPMMVASSVAGVVRAAALGRLAGSTGSWLASGLGARIGAGGLAFAAEVPAFTLSGRALHALDGQPAGASLTQELAAAGLSLGCLKGFVGLGAKLSPNPLLSAALFAPAGLYTAHGIEERLGWRPASDSTSRAVDALAASLSLGIGARFGRELVGEGFHRRLGEATFRAETARARARLLPELRAPWLPQPVLMSAESGEGKPPAGAAPEVPRAAESSTSAANRELKKYREIFGLSLMGDPLHNIEARLEGATLPVRILDLNPGDGGAVTELRRRFGDRVVVETVKDRHESGDLFQADFEGRSYDLIFSLLGAPSAEGQLVPLLQKAASLLAPGGELGATFSAAALKHADAMTWRELETLPKIRAGLEQGFALRLERVAANNLLYAQRLGARGEISFEEILRKTAAGDPKPGTLSYLEKGLFGQPMSGAGQDWYLDRSTAARLAECLTELGAQEALIQVPNLPQVLLNRFMAEFEKSHHRRPAAHEIQHWIDGREPSALWSKEIFVDEWLRIQVERARSLPKPSSRPPGTLIAGLVGLGTLLGSSEAWAAGPDLPTQLLTSFYEGASGGLIAAAGLGLIGAILVLTRGRRATAISASAFNLDPQEKAYFMQISRKNFPVRFFYRFSKEGSPSWVIQLLAYHYSREESVGRPCRHPIGDRLLLRAAAADPVFVAKLPARHRKVIDSLRQKPKSPSEENLDFNWTVSTEADLSSEEITLPGGPKVLGRRRGAGTLGVGILALLSPRIAEASDGISSPTNWALGIGLGALSLLGAYGLGRWVTESKRSRLERLLQNGYKQIPPAWAFQPPANQQDPFRLENVHFISGMPELPREELEVVQTGSGARWYLLEPQPYRPGWVKAERENIFRVLRRPDLHVWERELALNSLLKRLVHNLRKDEEVGQAAKLMWDLAVAPRVGAEGRRWFQAAYSAFIHSPMFFEHGSPIVYRECLRLRRIFSDEQMPLDRRLAAVGAYSGLFRRFNLDTSVARSESIMAKQALQRFMEEGQLERGSLPFMTVNGAWLDIDNSQFLWRSGQRVGLKSGNEDWEGND